MNIKELADSLVTACREGNARVRENLLALYHSDAVSVEARDHGRGRETRGLEAICAKHDWWESTMNVSISSVSEPMVHGDNRFAVIFEVTGQVKETAESFKVREIAVYHAVDGKIVREEFFEQRDSLNRP